MRDLAVSIVIAAIVTGGSLLVRDLYGSRRWELVPGAAGTIYRLDRASGNVSLCTPLFCRAVPNLVPAVGPARPGPVPPPAVPGSQPPAPPSTGA